MTTKTTDEITQLKAAHKATWDSGDYAAVADAFVLEIGERAVAKATITPGTKLLDVATGSGSAAIPAALAGAEVIGLDIAPTLLEKGRRWAADVGAEVEWVEGDAEDLPYADGSFDAVISVLGVQFAPRHEVCATELARVMGPGGELVLGSWTPTSFIGRVFKTLGPHMPKPPEGVSPPPLWGSEEYLEELFDGSGVSFEHETRAVDFEAASPEAWADFMADNYGPILKLRERLAPEGKWDGLRAELVALAEESNVDERAFRAPSDYLLSYGRKPS